MSDQDVRECWNAMSRPCSRSWGLGIPPTGRSVRVPYSAFYDVADDRITALRLYMSLIDLTAQLQGDAVAAAAPAAG